MKDIELPEVQSFVCVFGHRVCAIGQANGVLARHHEDGGWERDQRESQVYEVIWGSRVEVAYAGYRGRSRAGRPHWIVPGRGTCVPCPRER